MHFLIHFFQSFPQDGEFFEFWVEGKDGLRFEAGLLDEFHIAEILHRAVGDAGLAGSQKLARTADFEIFFGQFESVFGIDEGLESLGSFFGIGISEQENNMIDDRSVRRVRGIGGVGRGRIFLSLQ